MLLTVKEVCALLRLSPKTVHKLCDVGTLRGTKISPRILRISEEALNEYLLNSSGGTVDLHRVKSSGAAAPAPSNNGPEVLP